MKIHFIDTETTGLGKHDEPIAIAIVEWNDGETKVRFDKKFRPSGIVTEEAAKINGYTEQAYATAATFFFTHARDIARELQDLEYWGGSNPAFDRRILEGAFERVRVPWFAGHRNVDTCSMAAPLVAAGLVKSASLSSLVTFFDPAREQKHTALQDCFDAIFVFEKMLELYCTGGLAQILEAAA